MALHARGEPLAAAGIKAFREAQHRRGARQRGGDLGERAARNGEDDELRGGERRLVDERRIEPAKVGGAEVARVVARLADRMHLFRIAARKRHVVVVVAKEAGERRPPRAAADDDDRHLRGTKSMVTGTPSSSNSSRSWFSTQ